MLFITVFVITCLISSWVYVRGGTFLKRAVVTAVVLSVCFAAMIFSGPLSSGALFLLLPVLPPAASSELPSSYQPLHQGHVDLATGLYIREDEDIVLSESPSFVWRRAYLSRDHVARPFGVGATHNAQWSLIGDANTLQRIELVLENGSRIGFDRTSRGDSTSMRCFFTLRQQRDSTVRGLDGSAYAGPSDLATDL